MPEIPNLTFQITRPIDEDVTGPAPDSERCIWRAQSSEVDVRVKKLFKSRSDWRNSLENTAVARELVQWHKIRHSNVVSVFGVLQRDLTPFLVTPWIVGGNLNLFLTQHDQLLSPVDCISLIRDVAAGLHCLHSLSIVHGSLIGANILVDNGRRACLTDFGLASIRGPIQGSELLRRSSDAPGAIRWTATEIIVRDVERPTIHSDIYSFGSVALQIVTGKVPWSELEDDVDVVVKLSQGLVPWKPEDCRMNDSLWVFIQQCWEFVPEDRPTSSDALDFAEIEFRATLNCERYQATQPSQGAPAHTLVSARSTAAENHSTSIGTSPAPSRVVSLSVAVPLNTVGSARPVNDASAPLTSSVGTPAIENEVKKSSKPVLAMTSNHVGCRVSTSTSPEPPTSPASSIISTTATSAPSGLFKLVDIAKSFLNFSSPSLQSSSDTFPTTSAQPSLSIPQPSSQQGAHLYTSFVPGMYPEHQDAGIPRPRPFTRTVADVPTQPHLGASMEDPSGPPIPASPRMAPYPHKAPPACMAPQVPTQRDGKYYSHSPQSPTVPIPPASPVVMSRQTASILIKIEELRRKREVEEGRIPKEEKEHSETKRKQRACLTQEEERAQKNALEAEEAQLETDEANDTGSHRMHTKRGEKLGDSDKQTSSQQGQCSAFGSSSVDVAPVLGAGLGIVAPLEMSANCCVPTSATREAQPDTDTPEMVNRKVKGLLDKLTMERFDSLSDEIVDWVNKNVDGRTLIQFTRLVFEKAMDEAACSAMYARLCRKMMEQISLEVQDYEIKNTEGKPIAGGQLFWKHLLRRCQEDFERVCVTKEAIHAVHEKNTEETGPYSDEYYAAQKARGQVLGLIKFLCELFKLQMLNERIMHDCVQKLLGNIENPEEEQIEGLCQLLKTAGQLLDTPKASAHMDIYFTRIEKLGKSVSISARMQLMLQDIIELRERKWFSHDAVDAPTTIASIFEVTSRDICHITPNPELTPESSTKHSHPTSRKSNSDPDQVDVPDPNSSKWTTFEQNPEVLALRKKLQLLPQLKSSDVPADIKQRIGENSDDFFNRCNLEQADAYFIGLPKEHRFRLVEKLIAHALSGNYEADARLVSYFFAQAASNGQCTSDIFEKGFMPMACLLDEVAINFPKAFYHMAMMLKGAGFENEPERLLRIAFKLKDSNNLLSHFSLDSLQ